ncbi:MAG: MopE-related protein [Myxococcota bacterium]
MSGWWLWTLLACPGGNTDPVLDADGDGYLGSDCDDNDAAVFPGATEVCDGVDNDCDGEIDDGVDGAQLLHADVDGDTFGDPAVSRTFCTDPGPGWVTNFEDCDDTTADNAPGQPEICDGIDNDCDGLVDDEDESLFQGDWTFDADQDGYGAIDGPSRCTFEDGFVLEGGDCDDADPTLNPGVLERCDGIDNDCDGLVDAADEFGDNPDDPDDPQGRAVDARYYYPDADEDGFGDQDGGIFSCSAVPGFIEDGSDCDDSDDQVYGGAPERKGNGIDDNCNTFIDEDAIGDADVVFVAEEDGDLVGWSVFGPGDVTGDGLPDLLIGAPGRSQVGVADGAVYLIDNDVARAGGDLEDGVLLQGDGAGDRAGSALSGGDMNRDGVGDVFIGAPGGEGADGGIFVLYGPVTTSQNVRSADVVLRAFSTDERAGAVLFSGDFQADGHADLLIGAPDRDVGNGRVYLISGASAASGRLDIVSDTELIGNTVSRFGTAVGAGDIDGDGLDDAVIGAPEYSSGDSAERHKLGAAYLFYGPVPTNTIGANAADLIVEGNARADLLGMAVAADIDLNGDGFDDLILGAPWDSEAHVFGGVISIFFGRSASWIGSLNAENASVELQGDRFYALAGITLTSAGDVDADLRGDLLVSAPGLNTTDDRLGDGEDEIGGVYQILGEAVSRPGIYELSDVGALQVGVSIGANEQINAVGVGDINGDILGDVLFGVPGADAVYVQFGD